LERPLDAMNLPTCRLYLNENGIELGGLDVVTLEAAM
jgi:hypothetical protein